MGTIAFVDEIFLYENGELGVRFEIDGRFAPGPHLEAPGGLPGNVRSAYLAAHGAAGGQAVLSISSIDVGSAMSPQELAEQLVIHNRYAAMTAERHGWTIHRPWEPTTVGGFIAMRNDYVAPGSSLADTGDPDIDEIVAQRDTAPGHVQGYVVYAGERTFQIMLGVNPPGNLDSNRRVMDQAMGSLQFIRPD
ncbi:MAG TPA: hypothetical protein VK576_01195 [Thermoleophilia bacterium]|nr:hypothetical protein [Thermoleophilia bacterium]